MASVPKLACADFTFPLLTLGQTLDLIASLEFDGVDIGLFNGRPHLEASRELRQPAVAGKRLRAELHQRGLRLSDVFLIPGRTFSELAPNHPDASVRRRAREQFKRAVEYTVNADGRHLSGLPGVYWPGEPRSRAFARSVEELGWRVAEARVGGITFSVEPHIGSLAPRPRDALRLAEATAGLTLTLDYGHFTRAGFKDTDIEPLVRHASHFHCRGGRKGALQTSFQDNTINFARVLTVMRRTGYRGFITLEYVWSEWEDCTRTDNLSETIRFRDYLRHLG